jgi:hypothetical protein
MTIMQVEKLGDQRGADTAPPVKDLRLARKRGYQLLSTSIDFTCFGV